MNDLEFGFTSQKPISGRILRLALEREGYCDIEIISNRKNERGSQCIITTNRPMPNGNLYFYMEVFNKVILKLWVDAKIMYVKESVVYLDSVQTEYVKVMRRCTPDYINSIKNGDYLNAY